MKNRISILLLALVLAPFTAFAVQEDSESAISLSYILTGLVTLLVPYITLEATNLAKWMSDKIDGKYTLYIVGAIGIIISAVGYYLDADVHPLILFFASLGSTFLYELEKEFSDEELDSPE